MRTTFFRLIVLIGVIGLITGANVFAQQTRPRTPTQKPAAQKQPAADIKITYRSTTSGHTYQSTTMIKGARERNEMNTGSGMDVITITQCDLKRTLQISDRAKKYVITPMDTVEASQSPAPNTEATARPSVRGGVVTYTSTATDTGERKEMFGFTARHIKTSLTIQSSPDACNPTNQRMETDGWYIDLSYGLDCDLGRAQVASRPMAVGGCRDRVQFRRQGVAKTGYPLSETTTMYGPDGNVVFTSTKEVVELSRSPLDSALFDVPAGYAEARDTQELYAMPSMDATMGGQFNQGVQQPPVSATVTSTPAGAKARGALRVGVVTINNKTNKAVSIETLRDRLVGNIESAGVDAVSLNAISQMEAEIEAKAKDCDFILYTDITALKSSKLGGMFGRVTGVEGASKTEAKIEYKLFAVGESSPRLSTSATAKQEGEEASAGTAIDTEAKQVVAAVMKRS